MKHYPYLIVGGGMTADSAVAGIRELDTEKEIMLVSEENDPPYDRPPLSKSLWKNTPLEKIWRNTADKNADILLGQRVMQIRPEEKIVVTNSGQEFNYGKLLLATGAKKRKLPFGGEDILYFRTVEDYKRLREISEKKDRFAVIGSGFIGSEIAAALAMNGKTVTVIDVGPGIGANIFPPAMTQFLNNYFLEKGVELIPNVKVSNVKRISEDVQITLGNGKTLEVDCVVAGVGVLLDTELADAMHLSVENGIRVNEYLQTSAPDIYAAGDVANFYNPLLVRRLRLEHADNAKAMGKQAGRNMAGAGEAFNYLPFFYSDLFDLGYEAVGLPDARCEMVEDWQSKYEKGVIYYLENQRVRGVLLWNVWDKVDQAREVINLPAPVNAESLIKRIL